MGRNAKVLLAVLIGANVVAAIVVGILFTLRADLRADFLSLFQSSGAMRLEVEVPPLVQVGEAFELRVVVTNERDDYLHVKEILLPDTLLEAAVVTNVFPGSLSQRSYEGMTGFVIKFTLEPYERRTFQFTLQARSDADLAAEFWVIADTVEEKVGTRVVLSAGSQPVQAAQTSEGGRPSGEIPFKSVVKITAYYQEGGRLVEGWSGSGSIVSADGLILTNAHVVLPDKFFPVDVLMVALTVATDQDPVAQYYAEVLQADWELDLAVIRIVRDLKDAPVDYAELDLPAVALGNSDEIQLGDPLLILGYPGIGGGTITLTRGEASGFTGEAEYGDRAFIKTSAVIAGGNSGGLVADEQGRLIAIPTQLGYGGEDAYVDCRVIADTNRDGQIDAQDSCVPTGGFINALRPVNLALPLIEAAGRGELSVVQEPSPDIPYPVGRVSLYREDFSDPGSGWTSDSYNNGFAKYAQNEYQVKVDQENYIYWGVAKKMFSDSILTVTTRVLAPVGDGEYGVVCRLKDNDNFYGMSISEDGWYSIWKVEDGEITYLLDWDYSRAIPAYEPATLTAACVANKLTLAVDDVVLGEVTDYSFASGDIGLFGGTWEFGGFHVSFDDLEVMSP